MAPLFNKEIRAPLIQASPNDYLSMKFGSLQELDQWVVKNKENASALDSFRIPREKLSNYARTKSSGQKLMVCHDFKGNYCIDQDESPLGYFPHGTGDHYFLQYPTLVDIFIYFSHNRISIPPVTWTDMLHRHGILSLGCLIIEGLSEAANEEMDKLVERNDEGEFVYVNHLVLLAQRYGFDGWLINPETHFKTGTLADELILFTESLKSKLHVRNPQSKVVYYDSFISVKNRVFYQNGVNELNYPHFDSADCFFTNYWWDESHLKTTTAKIGFEGVKRKLFTGIDVWGRGSKIGTGGFETGLAVNVLKHYGSNVALFAPGWTYENFNKEDFISNDQKFWIGEVSDEIRGGGVATNIEHNTTPVFTSSEGNLFKFYSNFNQGEGLTYNINGKTVFEDKWVNISLQSYTPPTLKENFIEIEKYDSFNGGASLKIIHTPAIGLFSEEQAIPLFKFHNEVLSSSLKVSFTYKQSSVVPKGNYFQLEISYYIERRYRTAQKVSEGAFVEKLSSLSVNQVDWKTVEVELLIPRLEPREHFVISGVQLRYVNEKHLESNKFLDQSWIMIPKFNRSWQAEEKVELLVGDISICTADCKTPAITSLKKQELSTHEILVSWKDDYENVLHWLIYANGKLVTVSNTSNWILNKFDRVRIDVFTRDGKVIRGSDLFV